MSYMDVGKEAKRQGVARPRDARKLDPKPPAPKIPGKSAKGPKVRKRFGFTYEYRYTRGTSEETTRWRKETHWSWYATAKQRDDAMRTAGNWARGFRDTRNVQPIER